jgi:CHASE2 domain-containing sensor protein
MKKLLKYFFRFDLLIATSITVLFLVLMETIAVNIDFLDPLEMAVADIEFSDLAYKVFEDNGEVIVDTNIVLINVGDLSREGIAAQVEIINQYNPKVVGFDIVFEKRKQNSSDSLLSTAFSKVENLVLVNILGKSVDDIAHFDNNRTSNEIFTKYAHNGFANLPEGNSYRTIRNFYPTLYHDTVKLNAFAAEIIKHYNSSIYKKFRSRNNESETIKYRGNFSKFYYLDYSDVFDPEMDLSFIENKIVLFGYLGSNFAEMEYSLKDKFFTPLNEKYVGRSYPDMFGLTIHANIISMIIQETFITDLSVFANFLFSFFILYINAFIFHFIHKKYFNFYGGLSKVIMVFESVIILFICLIVFHTFRVQIDAKLSIIGLIFLPDILETYLRIKYKKRS